MTTMSTPWATAPLVVALAAACGAGGSTDIESTLRFADRSDTEIARMINAAVGAEMFQAQSEVDRFGDTFEADPCPTITISGNTATVTGGCTTADGVEIQGAATVTNPWTWDQFEDELEFGADSRYELHGLSFTQAGFTRTYDGFIVRAGDFRSWDTDLTTDAFGVALRSDLYMSCSGSATSATCTIGNSGLELLGVGGARISGTQRLSDQRVVTELTLRGVDTLTVRVADNCVAWAISGTDRAMTCP